MLLDNRAYTLQDYTVTSTDLKNQKSVKILGVHFTYDLHTKQKLNADELVISIQQKLRTWRWKDLTIIGRIQIVKTFIVPIFLYCASLISVNKGKDKVKRSALVSDIVNGGLRIYNRNAESSLLQEIGK